MLVLEEGYAHTIRNTGEAITDDRIRPLMIPQRLLGTRGIILIHTHCGRLTFTDDELKAQVQAGVGIKPEFPLEALSNLEEDVRRSIARIQASLFIPHNGGYRAMQAFGLRQSRLPPWNTSRR